MKSHEADVTNCPLPACGGQFYKRSINIIAKIIIRNLFSGVSNSYLTPKRALNLIKKNIIISNEIRNSNATHIYYSKRFSNKSGINEINFINQKSSANSKRFFGFILGSSDAIRAGFIGTTGRMRLNTRYGLSITDRRTINGQDLAYLVEEVYPSSTDF